jgi:hypothetical protein
MSRSATPPQTPSATPPTSPGPLGPGRPASWPAVIGIICIVLGGLSILGGLWGLLFPILFRGLLESAAKAPGGAAAAQFPYWVNQLSSGGMLFLSFILLAGGIALNSRRRVGPRLLLTWSILKIIFAIAMGIVSGIVVVHVAAMTTSQTGARPPPGLISGFVIFSMIFGLLWSAALPAFLLIWLNLASSRRLINEWP